MTHVAGERHFDAEPDRVFALLTDPAVIASAMPLVHGHRVIDHDHWDAMVKPPFRFAPSLTIHFEVLERRPSTHAALHAHGAGADVMSRFDLSGANGTTTMRWETHVQLHGMLSRFAGHGLDGVARHQAERTLDAIANALIS
ncbi:MAG TPA: SRPBCC domain-containing protein [Gaiellaceae bacterium]|nr:SRPBCC domain-containing protein [Gaiellaceae bacterium]